MSPAWISSREARRLRAIALEDVLERWGARPDPHDKAKWHGARGTISVSGMKFMNWTGGQGGGGAIDLAIQLLGVGFIEAAHWLQQHFPQAHEDLGPLPSATTSRRPPFSAGSGARIGDKRWRCRPRPRTISGACVITCSRSGACPRT